MARQIGTLGTIDQISVGGRVFTDVTTIIILNAYITTNGRFTTFRKNNTSAGYQVTAAKTLSINAVKVNSDAAAGTSLGCTLGYGDTDVGLNSAAAPTTPIYQFGAVGSPVLSGLQGSNTTNTMESATLFTIPATKFPVGVADGTNIAVTVYGYEA